MIVLIIVSGGGVVTAFVVDDVGDDVVGEHAGNIDDIIAAAVAAIDYNIVCSFIIVVDTRLFVDFVCVGLVLVDVLCFLL